MDITIDEAIDETMDETFFQQKKVIDQTKNRENVSSLEVYQLLLAQCDLEDNRCPQKSEVLYTFTPNKSYAFPLSVE